ncbi:hypothetical protein ACOMHN_011201 [Nucella lapillus]
MRDYIPENSKSYSEKISQKSSSASQYHRLSFPEEEETSRDPSDFRSRQGRWNDSPREWKGTQHQEAYRNTSVSVVPGSRSYSEVIKDHGPPQEKKTQQHRRIVMVKDSTSRSKTPSSAIPKGTEESYRDANSHQRSVRQTMAHFVDKDTCDTDQCGKDKYASQADEDVILAASQNASSETFTGPNINDQSVDSQGSDREASVVTDDDRGTDIGDIHDLQTDVYIENLKNDDKASETDTADEFTEQLSKTTDKAQQTETDSPVVEVMTEQKTVTDKRPDENDNRFTDDSTNKATRKSRKRL